MITLTDVQGVLGHWWYAYDQGELDVLPGLLTADIHFSCESDTGTTSRSRPREPDLAKPTSRSRPREADLANQTSRTRPR